MKAFIIFLIAGTLFAAAPKEIGTVVKVVGKVQRVNSDYKFNDFLKVGQKIFRHDEISTKRSSFVKLLLEDDSIFQLGSNSKFKFEKYNAKKGRAKEATYRLLYGKMRSLFIKQQTDKVMVTTPTVSMGIRGTEVLTDVFWDKSNSEAKLPKTEVALLSGKIELNMTNMPNVKPVALAAGEMFDSSKVALPKTRSVRKMPTKIFQNLKSGKSTFLFEAKSPKKAFPSNMPTQRKGSIGTPQHDSKAIESGKKRDVRKHFRKKRTMVSPPPPPPSSDATNIAPPGDGTYPPPGDDPAGGSN